MSARHEIVALLADCDLATFDLDGTPARHHDGRLFSEAEMDLLEEAGREDITEAARRAGCGGIILAIIGDIGEHTVLRRRADKILHCYPVTEPAGAVLPLMSDADRAEYERLQARLGFLSDQMAAAWENELDPATHPYIDPRGGAA